MARGRGKQDGGRGDGGRGDATRHSRRTQGLPAEEHKDLDVISRENRARKKAERDAKAAAEQKQKATENTAQDDQVSTEAAESAPSSSSKPGGVEEEQAQNPESAPASEGGANVGEPPAADRVSDSPPPDQDVEVLKVVPAKVKVEVTEIEDSEAEAESALKDADASSRSPQSSSSPPPSSSQDQASGSKVLPQGDASNPAPAPEGQNAVLRSSPSPSASGVQLDETVAKNFVARQVYRWEQMRSGRVVPPSVEYTWPIPRPDFTAWQEATMATSDYLRNRMTLNDRDAAWISELRPERRVLGIAQDLKALAIPPAMMTARECAAVLETLLFEAGFEFVNAVPDWFLTHASKINPGYVRSVVGELQQVLTIELIEWKQLTAGVPYKVVPAVRPERAFNKSSDQGAQSQGAKDDLLMEDFEVELLGRAFISQCRMAGIMALRSPRGSPENEPEPKRPQRRPARPLSISTPSDHSLVPSSNVSLNSAARAMSVQGSVPDPSSSGISDSIPSMIGPSGTSDNSPYTTSFGTMSSREIPLSSSLMSLGHGAASHMRLSSGPLVMSVQAGGTMSAPPDSGMVVPQTVTPPRRTLPDQEDVDMTEIERVEAPSSRTTSKHRSSRARSVKTEKSEPSHSESGLTSEGRHLSSASSRHGRSQRSRSSRTNRSMSSGSRSLSASSGAAQVALNLMHQLQEHQTAFQAQLSQAQLNMRLVVQRELQGAGNEIHALKEEMVRVKAEKSQLETALAQAEASRAEAEQSARDQVLEDLCKPETSLHPWSHTSTVEPTDYERVAIDSTLGTHPEVAEIATRHLREQHEADREELERRWKQRLDDVEAEHQRADADHARRAAEADREMNARLDSVQQIILSINLERERERAERDLERETALNRQKHLAGQNRELRATLSQIQALRATHPPELATGVKAVVSSNPDSATKNPVSSGAINDDVPTRTGYVHLKNTTEVGKAQLEATLGTNAIKQEASEHGRTAKDTKTSRSSAVKTETASMSEAGSKPTATKGSSKRPPSRRTSSRKGEKEDADPPSSDPDDSDSSSSGSSDGCSSSSGFSSSSSDDMDLDLTTSTTTKEGTTVWTYRPYINYNAVEKFNEDASVEDIVGGWERFIDMASQGSWPDKVRIRQLRGRISSALRDWYAQLPKSVRHNWKQLSHRFKVIYCRTTGSYAERYYTMKVRSGETALKFFYRLNAAAVKAGIQFQKPSKRRERHLRRFIKKLKDTQLKTALQGQRFKSISDAEHALRRHEDIWREEGYDTPPPKTRDFRADNDHQGRFRPRRSGRAFVVQDSEPDSDSEPERRVRFEELDDEEMPAAPSAQVALAQGRDNHSSEVSHSEPPPGFKLQDMIKECYRVMESEGWRPPFNNQASGPRPPSPAHGNPPLPRTCDKCGKFGHSREYCWADLTCDRCHDRGHPTEMCRVNPCPRCNQFHRGISCEAWRAFQAMKKYTHQGMSKDVPTQPQPKRVGLKKTPELYALVYVGPELRRRRRQDRDNQQCMTVFQDSNPVSDNLASDNVRSSDVRAEAEAPIEFQLQPGERYGWWEDHEPENAHEVAMVHGAVNNCRTKILLDSGASVSMLSFDFARKLKLKVKSHKQMKVSGLGGVPTYITAHAEVKITLGPRVVYVFRLWVANIGEGVDVLLGVNFMFSAGVRLSIREGLVQLPDEETTLMYGGPDRSHMGLDLPVNPTETLYLDPGQSAIVRIRYGQSNPQREVVWAGRGDRWVTKIVYAAKSWPVAVKVVNISDKQIWIDPRTAVARIVEYGFFPRSGRFVRPGKRQYQEWQQLIYENTLSAQAQMRADRLAQLQYEQEPPCVQTPSYPWPSKILPRPANVTAEVRLARLCSVLAPSKVTYTDPADKDVIFKSSLEMKHVAVQTDEVVEEAAVREVGVDTADLNGVVSAREAAASQADPPVSGCTGSAVSAAVESGHDDCDDEMEAVSGTATQGFASTPVEMLEREYARCMRLTAEELDFEPAVYIREGSELMAQWRDQLAMLPEMKDLNPECKIEEADVGEEGAWTPEMNEKLRDVLKYHRKIFLGDGNAAPAPARGVVCELDVGDAKPVAQRARQIAPHHWVKVYELLKKLFETGLIEYSFSEWASPIVIVLKKNAVDIRMCIDYRVVNQFIKLSCYPLPLIDDLLVGFESAMWFMSLDMASGFWAVLMTERAKLISAFICPFGHFQWVRMPFGLKNAPLVYQSVINNCLWGFVRLPPEEEAKVDREVLEFLELTGLEAELVTSADAEPEPELPVLTDAMTVFKRNIPAPPQMGPVLGRSSYIDDIAHGAPTWDQLCDDLNALLFRLRYWNISVSLPKSEFGKLTIPYLSHEVSAEGIRATPKIAKSVQDLPFPSTLKGVQSFLGSLNYRNKFIEDLPVVAAVLYELTDDQVRAGRDLSRAKEAFEILKRKIVSTPLLRHPDRTRQYVIIPHANPWAACAVLGQVEGCGGGSKGVGAVQAFASSFRVSVADLHSVLVMKWLLGSNSADGRCLKWGLELSRWSLEIRRVQRDEDGLAAILGAGITPREDLDAIAEELIPAKGRIKPPPAISIEMLEADYQGVVLSFDRAAKTSTQQGSCGCVLWQLPGWTVSKAHGFMLEDVTVNDTEYHGLLNGLKLASERGVQDLVVVGDSRIVIQQAQGLINCHQPNLQRRLAEYEVLRAKFKTVQLVHVKRLYNQAADYLTSKTLALGKTWTVEDADELLHLQVVSRIPEQVMKPNVILNPESHGAGAEPEDIGTANIVRLEDSGADLGPLTFAARVLTAVTRQRSREDDEQREPMGPVEYQAERWRRIKVHQDGDAFLMGIKSYLRGDLGQFSRAQVKKIAKYADQYVLDSREVLYRLSAPTPERPRNKDSELRLVVPERLRPDMLHYAHEDYQGGRQGITRTYERLRSEFYWPRMYADVEVFVKECTDCASAKGRPPNPGPSPGNIEPTRPFEVVSMDFITHLRGITFLLLFQDAFSGYVMCKPMSSTTAQDVAEAYEELVFKRFGASSMLRHDQDPRFMSDVFTRFRELMGSRQRATLAYRPQANDQQEWSVQTVVRSVQAYIAESDQSDWDEHAERLMFALNTSFDVTRLDTPFYLVHGWDAQGTVSAMLGPKPSGVQERTAYEWRRKLQRDYSYAQACAEDLQRKAKRARSAAQTQKWMELSERLKAGFKEGDTVWLYIPKVQPGLSRKLAHLWHGPFRIEEVHDDFRVKLKVKDTGYRVNPWVHVSRLKPRALFPERPAEEIDVDEDDDFDTALLPEDSWEPDAANDEYEVEKILDLRWKKRTRTSRRTREYLVKWKGYGEAE
ncbi:unnamed protein product [Phytophthora fragariaefolia]|uniref:Unnamed protein product n=1 Tax=Phytophthora fragariaefolia TaxID=1490495 RepID=A0A9W6Y3A3_9STRA|nr:unnamed protein product [Phytophthora fragariaefolia]